MTKKLYRVVGWVQGPETSEYVDGYASFLIIFHALFVDVRWLYDFMLANITQKSILFCCLRSFSWRTAQKSRLVFAQASLTKKGRKKRRQLTGECLLLASPREGKARLLIPWLPSACAVLDSTFGWTRPWDRSFFWSSPAVTRQRVTVLRDSLVFTLACLYQALLQNHAFSICADNTVFFGIADKRKPESEFISLPQTLCEWQKCFYIALCCQLGATCQGFTPA